MSNYSEHIKLNSCIANALLALTAASIILAGCQSAVRFTSKNVKESAKDKPAIAKEKSKEADKPYYSYEPMTKYQSLIVREAERWIGTPHCWGGESLKCTDCSGFVQQVYQKAGIDLPRTAAEQYITGMDVDEANRQAGDLIFFSNGLYISHVGIYVGNNYFIHASSSLGVIREWVNDDYFRTRFAGYKRVMRA